MTSSRKRTLLGVGLFIPLAAVLLATFACLPAPVGDPAASQVDAKLTGAWQGTQGDKGQVLALLRPWDEHTYYLQYMLEDKKDGKDMWVTVHYKAWLTKLGDATFITAEPLDLLDYAFGGGEDKKYWIVGRIERKDDTLSFRMVKQDSWIVKDLKTREKLEEAIKAQVNNDELYDEMKTFKRIPKDKASIVEEALKTANIGLEAGK